MTTKVKPGIVIILALVIPLLMFTGVQAKDDEDKVEYRLDELDKQVATLQADLATANKTIAALQSQLTAEIANRQAGDATLQSNLDAEETARIDGDAALGNNTVLGLNGLLTLDTSGDYPTALFTGVNVQVVNGLGTTDTSNGLGNLMIGYNEEPTSPPLEPGDRSGSHNLVVGNQHRFSSYGGLVAGSQNTVSGAWASVSGGALNLASDPYSSVSGGIGNWANGHHASVSGGFSNEARGYYSWVGGGQENKAIVSLSSVSGGYQNEATGVHSHISGGHLNTASGQYSSVSGGRENIASGRYSSISGGTSNEASGEFSSISAGVSNKATSIGSSVSGGDLNTASGTLSSVSGGTSNEASEFWSSVAGGSNNIASGQYSSVSGGFENTVSNNYETTNNEIVAVRSDLDNEISSREDGDTYLQDQIDGIQTVQVPQNLLDLAPYVSVDQTSNLNGLDGPHVIFERANIHVRNGLNLTDTINGLGNLIVGYDEDVAYDTKTGSHNLVVGEGHTYTSYGGIVVGTNNAITGEYSNVSGGFGNTASGMLSSVTGGRNNEASAAYSTISGGFNRSTNVEDEYAYDPPDYDSGWQPIDQGGSITLEHYLGGDPDQYIVDMEFKGVSDGSEYIHNIAVGGFNYWIGSSMYYKGAYWAGLTDQQIRVYRYDDDSRADYIRMRIWKNR